jgi:hypothetical protein
MFHLLDYINLIIEFLNTDKMYSSVNAFLGMREMLLPFLWKYHIVKIVYCRRCTSNIINVLEMLSKSF